MGDPLLAERDCPMVYRLAPDQRLGSQNGEARGRNVVEHEASQVPGSISSEELPAPGCEGRCFEHIDIQALPGTELHAGRQIARVELVAAHQSHFKGIDLELE